MRISPTHLVMIAAGLLILGGWLGRALWPADSNKPQSDAASKASNSESQSAEPTIWTCSMHPQVQLPKAGQCPICFMDLIPLETGEEDDLGPRTLELSAHATALAGIRTVPVKRMHATQAVRMVGKVAYDETQIATITAWVPGRLERLFVDYTGTTVREGDHMVSIYSPDLYAAQQELLNAIETTRRLKASSIDSLQTASRDLVVAAREKLGLLGLSSDRIKAIVERGSAEARVQIDAPMGGVVIHKEALEGMYVQEGTRIYTIANLKQLWVMLDAYETDLPWLRYGQRVEFEVESLPGERFEARIAFISPELDERTRTVKVRLNVQNPDLRLKPSMFVSAVARAELSSQGKVIEPDLADKWMCPMHPEILSDQAEDCSICGMDLVRATELGFRTEGAADPPIVIPVSAPLITGTRAVVYVRDPNREAPTFEGREVVLGPRSEHGYVVLQGLEEGESVVVQGAFKLDSELQIQARPSMMNPRGGGAVMHHEHGVGSDVAGDADLDEAAKSWPPIAAEELPEEFRVTFSKLVSAYLDLQKSLAADELEQALQQAEAMDDALHAVESLGLVAEPAEAWAHFMQRLHPGMDSVAGAEDIAGLRTAFGPLSEALVATLAVFPMTATDRALSVFHCPMAMGGKGGDWLAAGSEVLNPYFGASMLHCGERVRSITNDEER